MDLLLWSSFAALTVPLVADLIASKPKNPLGRSRWADSNDLEDLCGPGIVFGRQGRRFVEKPTTSPGHALIVGGTGAGKSRGVAIPSLLRWPGAVLTIDIKGELHERTAACRKAMGYRVFTFDPEDPNADPYDPLLDARTVDGAQELARTLIPEQGKDPFWSMAAQGIIAAAAYEAAHTGVPLQAMAQRLCLTSADQVIQELRSSRFMEARVLTSVCVDASGATLGSVLAELRSKILSLAVDPSIGRATRKSGWSAEDLDKGASIYLRVSERQIEQYQGLFTAIVAQVLRHLASRAEGAKPPVLLMLDELPRLNRLKGLINALSTLRSRNVHLVLVIQSLGQLDAIYGREARRIIADNCGYKLVLGATDPETQRYFSELAGSTTVKINECDVGVPLLRPEEWGRLRDEFILLAPKCQPAKLTPAWWDQTDEFLIPVRKAARGERVPQPEASPTARA